MYKVEWSEEMEILIGPYHDFICEVLKFVNEEPKFIVKQDSDTSVLKKKMQTMVKDESNIYSFFEVAIRTNLKEYICELKYEGINLLDQYNEFVDNYENFLSLEWNANITYSKQVTEAFEYFYTDLIHGKIFNDLIGESNAIKEFRERITLESTCPYCDIHDMEFDIASIDHFIPKARYPLLAIYPKNLVVACSACNDRIKKEKLYLPIIHPYFNNLDDYFCFTYKNNVIEFEFLDHISVGDREKVENFFKLFNIEKRYNRYCQKKLKRLKEEIQRNVIKLIKSSKDITIGEIESNIREEICEQYNYILKEKKIDPLTKLRLDYLKQMSKEDLSDLSLYIANENSYKPIAFGMN
ncbi:HNH endonuclease [Paenibacillus sp. FSL H8-0104]|uniref:HNH endonuclease n=1 Tax=Paenibacillus sp. FSL H8-0104 TaxID=2954509 RepID=UPI0030FD9D89